MGAKITHSRSTGHVAVSVTVMPSDSFTPAVPQQSVSSSAFSGVAAQTAHARRRHSVQEQPLLAESVSEIMTSSQSQLPDTREQTPVVTPRIGFRDDGSVHSRPSRRNSRRLSTTSNATNTSGSGALPSQLPTPRCIDTIIGTEHECAICCEPITSPRPGVDHQQHTVSELFCGHVFHSTCIDPWLERNSVCPLCRGDVVFKYSHRAVCGVCCNPTCKGCGPLLGSTQRVVALEV